MAKELKEKSKEEPKYGFKPNVIKADFGSYRHFWRGEPKVGKSTLFRDVVIEEYGDAKHGLLISLGNETGHKALDGVYAIEARTWEDFKDLIDELVENPDKNEFRVIGLDTVDQLVDLAIERTLKDSFKRSKKGIKPATINSAMGGFGQGHKHAVKLINKQINRIENAGYGLIFIGHTKIKDFGERDTEGHYQQMTTNLDSRFGSVFTDKADIVATFRNEKNVDKEGGVTSERYIYFRDNGFVQAGTRFSDMPNYVELSAPNYLDAFHQGVKGSLPSGTSSKKISEMKEEEKKSKKASGEEYSKKEQNGSVGLSNELETVEDYRKKIKEEINSLEDSVKRQKKAELEGLGIDINYSKIEDLKALKTILKKVLE